MKLKKQFSVFELLIILLLLVAAPLSAQTGGEKQNLLLPGNNSLNFLVISDWGRDGLNDVNKKTPGQLKVAKQFGITAKEIEASFVVTCGDNFHGKGVPSATDTLWFVNFENVYTNKSLMIPWYIALGNHDNGGNVEGELEYAKNSKRWIQPARYFSFTKTLPDSTEALFVILDSSPFIEKYYKDKEEARIKEQSNAVQVKWCDSVLSASKAKWKFAIFHHPAYSASSTHGSTKEIQTTFIPIFEKYHIDACFSGHDHDLQHSRPENSKIEYFGVGGGSQSRSAGHAAFTKYSFSSLGFGVVSLTQNKMRFSFVNEKGEQLYFYDIQK